MNYPQLQPDSVNGPRAIIHSSMGDIVIQLFPEQAPKAVENFVTLAKQKYYEEVIFHRVINDFMIQGGDPTGTGMGGSSIWDEPFEDEFSKDLYNLRGAVSMANSGPNTNGSQFFIVQNKHMSEQLTDQMKDAHFPEEIVKAYQKGGTPWLDFRHTVFGQVVDGMDVVDKMATVKTDGADKPLEDIVIESVSIKD
ncbi:peptidylprolyl isomerase [Secundilactobacillus folii]|uniref:Peptidyl-prolyl cis-trans isomerase n=1 Tax=Secundilactobacillus folii TaxID=2678357 RepID=A0A7X2XX40_9LACO|nr:peptidylprolyl isomerase [Secundilactobacillus folii]MTV83216.1 peptidylprolyl isomerase [Secundilactobacillus folii]